MTSLFSLRTLASLLALLAPAALALAPSRASAQAFYVTVVELEGLTDADAAPLEAELPALARGCMARGSQRRFARGARTLIIDVGANGQVADADLDSSDVTDTAAERAFASCLVARIRGRTFQAPASQPAILELGFEYADVVPSALQPGGSGVRRGPRRRVGHEAHAQGTGLPPDRVRETVQSHLADVQRCMDADQHRARGRVELEITVQPDGHVELVTTVSSTTGSAAFDACLSEAVRTWVFPAPGARLAIRFPFSVSSEVDPAPPH